MSNVEVNRIPVLDEKSPGAALVKLTNGDNFFVAIADAARACSAMDRMGDFYKQFLRLDEILRDWITKNGSHIAEANLRFRDRGMLFVVVQKSQEFDLALAERLTALDLDVANESDLNLLELDVLAVPPAFREARGAFLADEAERVVRYA